MIAATLCLVSVFFTACKETQTPEPVKYDPSKPVTIASIAPDSLRVASQILITGQNFGSDKNNIAVEINGKKATVINVNPEGSLIYCIVPSLMVAGVNRTDGETTTATVKVFVGGKEAATEPQLVYTFSQNVSTFLGWTDQDGNSAITDGPFDKAQFLKPFWLAFDTDVDGPKDEYGNPRKNIYLIEEDNGLRFIDVYNKTVETIFRTTGDLQRPRTIAFNLARDTMIIANDAGSWGENGTVIIPRDPVTRKFTNGTPTPWRVVMHHQQCNGGAIHPKSGEYWFNSYSQSQVFKVFQRPADGTVWRYGGPTASDLNVDGQPATHWFFPVQDVNWEFNIQIAPSGSFAYIVSKNTHYIAKMDYDFSSNSFLKPYDFVGSRQKSGFQNGVGPTNTLFYQPQQGAFDKLDNFYVCDGLNHCIRKVTPQGQVSTFAGRPQNAGYSDGALRDAQFSGPFGIIYDDDIQTFYIADRDNKRIRTIKVE
jgi:hypothetical protein